MEDQQVNLRLCNTNKYWINMSKCFQILSLDGGGIKGVFSAAVLAYFEDDLKTIIANHFDLIVGTSTGGIIALALSLGYKPREILEFYVANGRGIFRGSPFSCIKHLFSSKYSPRPLERALKNYFKDYRLSDCKKRVIIPSYNLSEDDVYLFKTPHHTDFCRDYNIPLWKVAMATTAAPTYFPSFNEIDNLRLIDGGVWANNPTLIGITEAIKVLKIDISEIKVLSLGTTKDIKNRRNKLNKGGLSQWMHDGIDLLMHGQSTAAFNTSKLILGSDKIVRINPTVPDGLFKLDKLNIDKLIAKAAHNSRSFTSTIRNSFLSHNVEDYIPLYK